MTLAGNLICQGAHSDISPDQAATATTAAHRANNIIISSHHQVTARSRSVMNVKLTSFSLSRCKMIVPSKSRPGLGVRLHLSRVLDPSIGGHHLQYNTVQYSTASVATISSIYTTLLCPHSASLGRGSQHNKQKIVLCVPGYCPGLGQWD